MIDFYKALTIESYPLPEVYYDNYYFMNKPVTSFVMLRRHYGWESLWYDKLNELC